MRLVVSLAFAACYATAMFLGRYLTLDGETMAVIWPACGVAGLWFLWDDRWRRPFDLSLLIVITFGVNVTTGAHGALSMVFSVANLAQAVLSALLLRRLAPDLRGAGGDASFSDPRRVGAVTAVALIGSLLAAGLVAGARAVLAQPLASVEDVIGHAARNTYGFVLVVVTVHLLVDRIVAHTSRLRTAAPLSSPRRSRRTREGRTDETVVLVMVTALVYAVTFLTDLPLAFLPFAVALWLGLRFGPLVVALHSVGTAAVAIWGTLDGHGPFSDVTSLAHRALLVQAMLLLLFLCGMFLSATCRDLERTGASLARRDAASRAAVERLTTLVESVPEGVVMIGSDGRVSLCNETAASMIREVRLEEGRTWPTVWRDVDHTTEEPTELSGERAGEKVVLQLLARCIPSEGAATERVGQETLVVMRDVTREREQRDRLTAFALTAAHDMRGPLLTLRGWIGLLDGRSGTDPALVHARVVECADSAARVVADLLERATREDAVLVLERCPVEEAVRQCARRLGMEHRVVVHAGVGSAGDVVADPVLFRQVVTNLLDNAVKYADPDRGPHVVVSVVRRPSVVEIHLADDGVGLPSGYDEIVFEPRVRVRTGSSSGTGLGLALCRQIADRHGGSLRVDPVRHSRGACFVLTLPAAQVGAPAPVQ